MYSEMENVTGNLTKQPTHNVHTNEGSHVTACRMHTHSDKGEGQCYLTEISGAEKCLEFAFEGRECSSLWEIVPNVGAGACIAKCGVQSV